MAERRSLVDGLKQTPPPLDPEIERNFVFQTKKPSTDSVPPVASRASTATTTVQRTPISTRIRTDFQDALKRASLERQLKKIEPNSIQDLLEEALEPWLKANNLI